MQVKINQVYKAPLMAGRVMRRVRILAYHPDGGYIAEVLYSSPPVLYHEKVVRTTSLALRKAYTLEQDVCDHRGPLVEISIDEKDHPTHYQCTMCGDTFPLIGDTCLWFPKLKPVTVNATNS